MTLQEIESLINFIAKLGLEEVHIETDKVKLKIKRSAVTMPTEAIYKQKTTLPIAENPDTPPSETILPIKQSESLADKDAESVYTTIKSPMIGTFYRSSTPNKPPLVGEGDIIKKGQPVCIIEAMKLFNEIESELAGTIVEVLVKDVSPVEYDQDLFVVKSN